MRLHTDTVTATDVHRATLTLPGVFAEVTTHGSRIRDHALEVKLTGNGRRANSGAYGAGYENGATWDEWGAVMAALYELDPSALWGSGKYPTYRDAEHFHWVTGDRFREGMPTNPHKLHRFGIYVPSATGTYRVGTCKCGAIHRTGDWERVAA